MPEATMQGKLAGNLGEGAVLLLSLLNDQGHPQFILRK